MVLFVELEDEISEPPELHALQHRRWSARDELGVGALRLDDRRDNPNRNSMSEALGCYPIISEIAAAIDLNTLDSLSRTCRQVRENLLQFKKQLAANTLHCFNEDVEPNHEHTLRYRARASDWYFVEEGGGTGKVGECARDMVSECRRCDKVVCRNCTIKPPAHILLEHRHRRLCQTCVSAPLDQVSTTQLCTPASSLSGREIVTCACASEGVWLCQDCGRGLRKDDTSYEGIWRWRIRYTEIGTGISEGNRSVPCARKEDCLAAHEVEQETDCDAEDAREIESATSGSPPGSLDALRRTYSSSPGSQSGSPGPGGFREAPGYSRHEIEGIGGRLKKKRVRMVKVGCYVAEYKEERNPSHLLEREIEGRLRSWCGWCWKVIPAKHEKS